MAIRTELHFALPPCESSRVRMFAHNWNNPAEGVHMEVIGAQNLRVVINEGSKTTANDIVKWVEEDLTNG